MMVPGVEAMSDEERGRFTGRTGRPIGPTVLLSAPVARWLHYHVAWRIAAERVECTDRRGDERHYKALGVKNDKAWRRMSEHERSVARGIVVALNTEPPERKQPDHSLLASRSRYGRAPGPRR